MNRNASINRMSQTSRTRSCTAKAPQNTRTYSHLSPARNLHSLAVAKAPLHFPRAQRRWTSMLQTCRFQPQAVSKCIHSPLDSTARMHITHVLVFRELWFEAFASLGRPCGCTRYRHFRARLSTTLLAPSGQEAVAQHNSCSTTPYTLSRGWTGAARDDLESSSQQHFHRWNRLE